MHKIKEVFLGSLIAWLALRSCSRSKRTQVACQTLPIKQAASPEGMSGLTHRKSFPLAQDIAMFAKPPFRMICICTLLAFMSNKVWSQATQQPVNAWQYAQSQNRAPTPAMQYFGGSRVSIPRAQHQRTQRPGKLVAVPQAQQIPQDKPFTDTIRPQTISPYLNLDRLESGTSLPNYHTFVRPLIQQQQESRKQALQAHRQKQQVRMAAASSSHSNADMQKTGQSSQFMNIGNYYPGLRR